MGLQTPLGPSGFITISNRFAFDANVVGPAVIAAWQLFPSSIKRDPASLTNATWSQVAQGIVAPIDGYYHVLVQIPVDASTAVRGNFGLRVSVDGSPVGSEGQMAYLRNNSGHNASSNVVSALVEAKAGHVIGAQTRRLSTSGIAMNCPAGRASLTIMQWRGVSP